jgi:hypothetical protein
LKVKRKWAHRSLWNCGFEQDGPRTAAVQELR